MREDLRVKRCWSVTCDEGLIQKQRVETVDQRLDTSRLSHVTDHMVSAHAEQTPDTGTWNQVDTQQLIKVNYLKC